MKFLYKVGLIWTINSVNSVNKKDEGLEGLELKRLIMNFKKTVVHKTDEGGIIIEDVQDCTAILEKNKREYNSFDENARWSDEPFRNKIASIPLTVIDSLNKKGILKGFRVLDQKAFKAWLNDSDNRFFRTRTGRV